MWSKMMRAEDVEAQRARAPTVRPGLPLEHIRRRTVTVEFGAVPEDTDCPVVEEAAVPGVGDTPEPQGSPSHSPGSATSPDTIPKKDRDEVGPSYPRSQNSEEPRHDQADSASTASARVPESEPSMNGVLVDCDAETLEVAGILANMRLRRTEEPASEI
ncbi:hypothetical protein ISCGN_007288 [Ixodes scapularis]